MERQAEHTTAALALVPGGGGDAEGLEQTGRPTFKTSPQFPQASNLVAGVGETGIPWSRVSGREIPFCHAAAGPFYC